MMDDEDKKRFSVILSEMTFAEILAWSREQGMTKAELDERAAKFCVKCNIYHKCGNLRTKDWCHVACTYAINLWKEERGF